MKKYDVPGSRVKPVAVTPRHSGGPQITCRLQVSAESESDPVRDQSEPKVSGVTDCRASQVAAVSGRELAQGPGWLCRCREYGAVGIVSGDSSGSGRAGQSPGDAACIRVERAAAETRGEKLTWQTSHQSHTAPGNRAASGRAPSPVRPVHAPTFSAQT
ncbi:hypothetical protein Bbelb_412770 [Branchiostoma belcheri]|nr:hypothetical protein Bbelb_412770 [Branchiostoma belcheri]